MDKTFDNLLSLLLGCDETEDRVRDATIGEKTGPMMPSLDERVDIYLRGVYGFDREFTAEQRAETRIRILRAMAREFFDENDGEFHEIMQAFIKGEGIKDH